MDIFSSRELSLLTWLLGLVIFCLVQTDIRKSLKGVVEAFCQKQILICLFLFALYVTSVCTLLSIIGLWGLGNLKTTVFWFVGAGLVALFDAQRAAEKEHFFRDALKDQLSVIILLEFIVNFYAFSYWVELLILPVTTFLYATTVYAEGKAEYKPAHNFLSWILAIFGSYLLGHGLYMAIHNYSEIINQPQLIELVLLPLLSISILPFIYLLALFMTYEILFIRVNFWTKDEHLARLAKHRLIRVFNINLKQLIAFSKKHGMINIESVDDLKEITRKREI